MKTWNLPTGKSANKDLDMRTRMSDYFYNKANHIKYDNGMEIRAGLGTVRAIINSFDLFELPLALSEGSYQIIKKAKN